MNALSVIGCDSRVDVLVKLLRHCGPMHERDAERCTGWLIADFQSTVASATMARRVIRRPIGGGTELRAANCD